MTLFLAAFLHSEHLRVGRGWEKVPGASLCFLAGHPQPDLNGPDKAEAGRSPFRAGDTNWWVMDHIQLQVCFIWSAQFNFSEFELAGNILKKKKKKALACDKISESSVCLCGHNHLTLSSSNHFLAGQTCSSLLQSLPLLIASLTPGIWGTLPLSSHWHCNFLIVDSFFLILALQRGRAKNSYRAFQVAIFSTPTHFAQLNSISASLTQKINKYLFLFENWILFSLVPIMEVFP